MSKKFPLKAALFGLGITLALGLLIIVTTFFVSNLNNKQNLRSKATVAGGPSSVLFFDPASVSLQPSETSTVTININPGNNQVFGTQLALNFDPAKIKINSFTPSSSFSNALIAPQINNSNGTVNAVLTVPFPTQPADTTAAGIPPSPVTLPNTAVATVTFQALAEGSAVLSFTSDTIVVAKDETANVLASSTPLTVNVITPTLTPTNTPIPTVTSTPTSTPVPTAEPTVTPTATPIITITPAPGPQQSFVTLKFALQRITTKKPDISAQVTILDGQGATVRNVNQTFVSDDNGIYSATLPETLPFGTYTFKIKPRYHLSKKFSGQVVSQADQTLDFSGSALLAGDVAENNQVDIFDIQLLLDNYGANMPAQGSPADLDQDGKVGIFDVQLFIENYSLKGEN